MPEQMNLNVGLEEGVPACPLPGHNWGDIVHSNSGTWLVNWKSSLNDAGKYIFEILSNIRKIDMCFWRLPLPSKENQI